jgi:hypothetical protein
MRGRKRQRSTISPDDLLHRGAPSIAPTLIAQARYPARGAGGYLAAVLPTAHNFGLTQQDRSPRRNHNLGMLH